ncbi:MAG: trigger factor [Candidatus Brocadiia bacterium]
MNVEMKEVGPCKVALNIEIPPDKIKTKLDEKFKSFVEGTTVPGFRKGHAPTGIVERKFGKEIREEVKFDVIGEACDEAFKSKELRVLGEPHIDFDKIVMDEAKPMNFEVTVEVAPTVDLKDYKGVEVKRHKIAVDAKEVDAFIEELRAQNAELLVLEKEPAKEGDYLVVDSDVSVDGKSVAKQDNMSVPLGPEVGFFGKPNADIKKNLIGCKQGDTKQMKLTIPESYKDAQHRNKEALCVMTVKEIKRPKLPELSDKWAKDMGFDSLAQMKEEVTKKLTARKETEAEHHLEDDILDKLLAKTTFPLPESVVTKSEEQLISRKAMEMYYYRMPEDKIKEELAKFKTTSKDVVTRDLRIEFISDHIAKQEKIFVTEDEVKEHINKIAASSRKLPTEVRKEYESKGWMPELRAELKEEKVRKFLKEHAKITD